VRLVWKEGRLIAAMRHEDNCGRPHNAITDYVFARRDRAAEVWELSPDSPGTRIETSHGWLPRLVQPPSTGSRWSRWALAHEGQDRRCLSTRRHVQQAAPVVGRMRRLLRRDRGRRECGRFEVTNFIARGFSAWIGAKASSSARALSIELPPLPALHSHPRAGHPSSRRAMPLFRCCGWQSNICRTTFPNCPWPN
jgi:hypothetical protein